MNSCIDLWGESTGLYFFSAVFQGNMSLLALVGVFVVFKIQQLNSMIEHSNDAMVRYMSDVLSLRIPQLQGKNVPIPYLIDENGVLNIDAIFEYFKRKATNSEAVQPLREDDELRERQKNCLYFANQKSATRKEMKLPISLTSVVIIFSLICLSLIHQIHYWYLTLEKSLIGIVIIFNIVALFFNIKFIIQSVKNS